ncbi:hypothetical protein [Sphingomonas sp.]|uniref:hypothetical protein n=1 Tax=Sphingomonas sp. TaxID=28214 RepID=UPI0038AF38A9
MTDMRWAALIALTLTLVTPLAAAPPKAASKSDALPKLIQSCDAHKFETVVDAVVNGQPHKSKVKLCGVEGQSDTDWIGTLRDAIRKLEANKDMASATREQIVAAIKGEIARLSIVGPSVPAKRESRAEAAPSLSRDYATLPPLPPPPETGTLAEATGAAGPAVGIVRQDPAGVTAVPSYAANVPTSAAAPVPAPLVAPRLAIDCESPGDLAGSGPCAGFESETVVTIRPGEDIPTGTTLQFVRNGEAKGDIALDGLRKGRALRSNLPRDVCSGFGAGRLELRIVRAADARVLQSEGPYALRC